MLEISSYYNSTINDKNSKIDILNSEITNLNSQISTLNTQVANLTYLRSANLTAALTITECTAQPYNYILITGSVNNTGEGTAYQAGLDAIAYSHGTLEVNMTVPLINEGIYGANSTIVAFLDHLDLGLYRTSSLQLGALASRGSDTINIAIYHEGVVTNWTVTPVWTNTP